MCFNKARTYRKTAGRVPLFLLLGGVQFCEQLDSLDQISFSISMSENKTKCSLETIIFIKNLPIKDYSHYDDNNNDNYNYFCIGMCLDVLSAGKLYFPFISLLLKLWCGLGYVLNFFLIIPINNVNAPYFHINE